MVCKYYVILSHDTWCNKYYYLMLYDVDGKECQEWFILPTLFF